MCQKYRSSIVLQCRFHDFAGVDLGTVDTAGEQRFVGQQSVLIVQPEHHKHFPLQSSHSQSQPIADGIE
ncbi:hypothetical protein D3C79_928910 [compost metagenome]